MNTKITLGLNTSKTPFNYDIKHMPHLLIAGNAGSGKTQFLHNLIMQLIENNTSEEIKFIMSDCNRVNLIHYNNTPYLYAPIQTNAEIGPELFEWLDYEQTHRYEELERNRVQNIDDLNEKMGKVVFPRIIVIINELAFLMAKEPARVEKGIVRILQLAKSSAIHLIISTQVMSKDNVTGLIKANIPTRIAFRTNNEEDSKLIIDQVGAEKLKGNGDMLFIPPDDTKAINLQGTFISDEEIFEKLEKYKDIEPHYSEVLMYALRKNKDHISEDTYDRAKELIVREGKASASLIQKELSVSYANAARILDRMEKENVIGPKDSTNKERKVLQQI